MALEIIILIAVVGSAIVIHEVAHGWVALKFGDTTARDAGRLTLNPLKHVDLVGTLLIPGILIFLRSQGMAVVPFGWAKPVPVNFMRLRSPRKNMMWVALAGPISNICIALTAAAFIQLRLDSMWAELAGFIIAINLLLAVFNMIPIPPLDGSRVLMRFLPKVLAVPYSRLERYGIIIVGILLYCGMFQKIVLPVVLYLTSLLGVQIT